ICLFRNMEGDKVRNVKFLRDTPAFPTDEKTLLQVLSVETDGEFFPLEEPKLRMEVIGDSITSGEGCSGAEKEMTWNSFCFNAVDHYAYMAAK
ncbi:MAG TPA: GDSL family lipase, partial [Blautia sp.]|nr:GDSL family lipase [Blautia sp.]